MRARVILLCVTAAACNGQAGDTDSLADTDVQAACTPLSSGSYDARGACFGMAMTVQLAMDDAACTFTLQNWSMDHSGSAEGGTIDGDVATLFGGDFEGCTGEIDGGAVAGTCPADGCAWELVSR